MTVKEGGIVNFGLAGLSVASSIQRIGDLSGKQISNSESTVISNVLGNASVSIGSVGINSKSSSNNSKSGTISTVKTIQKIGDLDAKNLLGSSSVESNIKVAVNANATVLGGTSGSVLQNLSSLSANDLSGDTSTVKANTVINVSGKLGGVGTTIQNVGDINVKNDATGSKVKATLEDAVNVGVSVLGNTSSEQDIAVIKSNKSQTDQIEFKGKNITNVGAGIANDAIARQELAVIEGNDTSNNKVKIKTGTITNVAGALGSYANTTQEIGVINNATTNGNSKGNLIDLKIKNGVTNVAASILGKSNAEQDIGVMNSKKIENSQIKLNVNKIANIGASVLGVADAIQKVGSISSKNQADQVTINLKKITDITAAAVGVTGTGSVEQNIGVVTGNIDKNDKIEISTNQISGTGVGFATAKGEGIENIGVISATNAVNDSISIQTNDVSTIAVGLNSKSLIEIGSIKGQKISNQTINIITGNLKAESYGWDTSADIKIGVSENKQQTTLTIVTKNIEDLAIGKNSYADVIIGEIYGSGKVEEIIHTGSITNKSIAIDGRVNVEIGNVSSGNKSHVKSTITTGNINNILYGGADGANTMIKIGNVYGNSKGENKIDIKTGNIKSEVYASWDYNSGVYIGNINNVNRANVKINHKGDITSEAAACVKGIGCFTELLGEKNCVSIGNIGMSSHCNNESFIAAAKHAVVETGKKIYTGVKKGIQTVEHTAVTVEKAAVKETKKVTKAVTNEASKVGKGISKEASKVEKLGKGILNWIGGK